MSKPPALVNIFKADPAAKVIPIALKGLSLPKVESAGILANPSYPKVEGRGTYEELPGGLGRYRYVKGAGNSEALGSHRVGDPRRFPQFGHVSSSKFCFGAETPGPGLSQVAPRVRGALALPYAIREVVNAAVFLDVIMRKEGISTLQSAEARGLTVPEGAILSPAVSADICEGLARLRFEKKITAPQGRLDFKYGLAALRVPSCVRLRSRDDITATKGDFWMRTLGDPEKMRMVGRVLRHQLQCGFISLSTHLQNIYDAPNSLCPHADSSDLVAISEVLEAAERAGIERGFLVEALVMRQLLYMPFNLMRYSTQPKLRERAKDAIATVLSTVAPGAWTDSQMDALAELFQQKPYTVLSSIAIRLIDMRVVGDTPVADWDKIRSQHARFAYDIVADHLTRSALVSACSMFTSLADAEAQGGLESLG